MSESELIEISFRFRALEDAVNENIGSGSFAHILICGALESCREDMTAMMEQIRGHRA